MKFVWCSEFLTQLVLLILNWNLLWLRVLDKLFRKFLARKMFYRIILLIFLMLSEVYSVEVVSLLGDNICHLDCVYYVKACGM